jgi:hypothetical protein
VDTGRFPERVIRDAIPVCRANRVTREAEPYRATALRVEREAVTQKWHHLYRDFLAHRKSNRRSHLLTGLQLELRQSRLIGPPRHARQGTQAFLCETYAQFVTELIDADYPKFLNPGMGSIRGSVRGQTLPQKSLFDNNLAENEGRG